MFIVEDGTGKPDANSYQSVEAHKAYCDERGYSYPADDEKIKQDLIKATDYLRGVYRNSWLGIRAFVGQRLCWPRIGRSVGEFHLEGLGVPEEIREATSELAIVAAITPLMPNVTARSKKKVKVGPLEVEYDGNSPVQPKFVSASLKLTPFLRGVSSSMVRLTRV